MRRRHCRRPVHPLRGEHAEAVRGPVAADDRALPRRHPQGNRQACLSGGGALNVKLNQKIIARPDLKRAVRAAGVRRCRHGHWRRLVRLGAAGVPVEKMEHVYLGPACSNEGRDRRLRSAIRKAAVAADRQWRCRGAEADRADPRRRQPGGLVPRPHGVRPRAPSAAVRSLAARAPPASPTASTSRSSSASAGVRSARACSTPSARRCSAASTWRRS